MNVGLGMRVVVLAAKSRRKVGGLWSPYGYSLGNEMDSGLEVLRI